MNFTFEDGGSRQCNICEKALNREDTFVSEKAWKNYGEFGFSAIFELVMCTDCLEAKQGEISRESRENLQTFMLGLAPVDSTKCIVTGKLLVDCEYVQGAAIFNDGEVQEAFLSDEAMEQIQALLSAETLDFLDGFAEEQLGPPGAWKDLFSPTRPILM
ncbi:MAG: hypothetical protein JJU02_15440 [Cryomorphaceae bacterium]|nr:hypothetical protein [Cryomorphaceae bacterium]